MPLAPENLDDRTFEQLLADARRIIVKSCPGWTDLSPSDPGIVLLEVFAFLTETMIYRLNRLPQKAYVEFLRIMGVQRHPPAAARVVLRFSRASEGGVQARIEIARGTRVGLGGRSVAGESVTFATAQTAYIEPGQNEVDVMAFQCEQIDGERIGEGTGMYGWSGMVRRPPLIAATGDRRDLIVGVEEPLQTIGAAPSRQFGDKTYRIWTEVQSFAEVSVDRHVYIVDRLDGRITFAPAVRTADDPAPIGLAEAPPQGREIRVWYRRGGGAAGNVAANTLTVSKDAMAGIKVTNPAAASGGRDAETLANALLRGPQEIHSLRRAVTARDFERLATGVGGVARARAFTKAQVWAHAAAGTVQLLLVPDLPERSRADGVRRETLREYETEELRQRLQSIFDERKPLGTQVMINWAGYRPVAIRARIVAFRSEDPKELAVRIRSRLEQSISPLPTSRQKSGWPFGQPLQVGRIYDTIFEEPGVKDVEDVRIVVDDAPIQPVRSLAADQFQPHAWHLVSGNALYRSVDDGQDWERLAPLPGIEPQDELLMVRAHSARAGWVAAATRRNDATPGSRLYVSDDCGESWRLATATAFEIHDVAWILRAGVPSLLIASSRGLYELAMTPRAELEQLRIGDLPPDLGFWSIAVINDVRGQPMSIAVAAEKLKGVWISSEGGRPGTFVSTGLGEDVRVLEVQYDGSRSIFWAGVSVAGNVPGKGCYRWGGPHEGWQQFLAGWRGGTCYGIAVCGLRLLAATYDAGVLALDTSKPDAAWQTQAPDCGLPRRDEARPFVPILAVGADPSGSVLMAGTGSGVYRSQNQGRSYELASRAEFTDRVSLSDSALFCSANHEITVVSEDESSR